MVNIFLVVFTENDIILIPVVLIAEIQIMFNCCFGECPNPSLPQENHSSFVLPTQKRSIITLTKGILDIDSGGLFDRLYLPEELIDSSDYNFIK